MKTRILFVLSLCCFMASLGLLVGIGCSRSSGGTPLGSGVEIRSYCPFIIDSEQTLIDSVPLGKRFILTDVSGFPTYSVYLEIKSDAEEDALKYSSYINGTAYGTISFTSGLVFYPGDSIFLAASYGGRVTVSGYFINA